MAESSIPVDLFNPGQVFACLGFLEACGRTMRRRHRGVRLERRRGRAVLLTSGRRRKSLQGSVGFPGEYKTATLGTGWLFGTIVPDTQEGQEGQDRRGA